MKEEGDEPPRRYSLPPPSHPGYPLAAARALLEGADAGDSASAEEATGYRWGDPRLIQEVDALRREAEFRGDDRMEVLAERFLRAAGAGS